ncbi:MAG: 8-amino-7-oxononanoate synthase [Patescibacteria group bacterium]|nr:8-amino-7-oxononanoate synthase [Patescibacteria group bacterium]
MNKIKKILNYIDSHKLYPDIKIINGSVKANVFIDEKKVLMFSSNNYIGIATHPRVVNAAVNATKKYGVGSGGSRMLSGNLRIHRDFEFAIAKFKGYEDAIVWPSGYSANVGIISALINPLKVGVSDFFERKGVIFSDELNHASIIDGCQMSKQKIVIYRHNNVGDLEKKLKKYKKRRELVVTDSVFSMDGDIAPLDKIAKLCKKYDAMLMIDEAHATGVLGDKGHGAVEYFNLDPSKDVDVIMGTCSKALGVTGGFVVGSKSLIRYLRVASRSYIFSTAMTPASSAALIEALKVIEDEPEIREKMWKNVKYLRESFNKIGFDTITSETQIIPVLIGKEEKAIEFARKLLAKGIFAPCVRWPAVRKNKARIRFTVMSEHTKEQIDYLLQCCCDIGKDLNIIK